MCSQLWGFSTDCIPRNSLGFKGKESTRVQHIKINIKPNIKEISKQAIYIYITYMLHNWSSSLIATALNSKSSLPPHPQNILWFDSQSVGAAPSLEVKKSVDDFVFSARGWEKMRVMAPSGGSQGDDMRWRPRLLRDYPPAGTEAPWQWSSPPKRPAGTRRWASPRGPSSSIAPSARAATWGSPEGTAFGSPARPAPAPPGCSCL